jgi:hypothetical protein
VRQHNSLRRFFENVDTGNLLLLSALKQDREAIGKINTVETQLKAVVRPLKML